MVNRRQANAVSPSEWKPEPCIDGEAKLVVVALCGVGKVLAGEAGMVVARTHLFPTLQRIRDFAYEVRRFPTPRRYTGLPKKKAMGSAAPCGHAK